MVFEALFQLIPKFKALKKVEMVLFGERGLGVSITLNFIALLASRFAYFNYY